MRQSFPAETFAPKVQKEIHVEPKHLPRNVEMERRRRLYRNLRVQDALNKAGVSSLDILPPDVVLPLASDEQKYGLYPTINFLPLEIFDDEDFDCRLFFRPFVRMTKKKKKL